MRGSDFYTRQEIIKKIKDAVRGGDLRKGDVLNPHRIRKLTGVDIRTAHKHAPSLEGEKVNGHLAILNPEAGPWLVIDDPSDEWLDPNLNEYLDGLNGDNSKIDRSVCDIIEWADKKIDQEMDQALKNKDYKEIESLARLAEAWKPYKSLCKRRESSPEAMRRELREKYERLQHESHKGKGETCVPRKITSLDEMRQELLEKFERLQS